MMTEKLPVFRRKTPRAKRLILFSLFVLFLGMVILFAGSWYICNITPPESHTTFVDAIRIVGILVSPGQVAFGEKQRLNILCLGIDENWTKKNIMYTKGARSDTIFVVSLDSSGKTLNVLFLPRDTRVLIPPDCGYEKINAAYSLGGVNLARKTVENFLGATMDYYVVLKVRATQRLVDAIGGINVDVEKDMKYDDSWGHLHISLKAGPQRLNGEQAVGYVRFRHDEEADWGRIRRQQQVLAALVKELKKPTNLMRMGKIARIVRENIETDLTIPQLTDLARLYKDFDRRNMKTGVIKGTDEDIGGLSYIIPDEKEKKILVRRLLQGEEEMLPEELRVAVFNASGETGAAREVAEVLRTRGYQVVKVESADRSDCLSTQILDHIKNLQAAMDIDQLIGPAQVFEDPAPSPSPEVDITILVGKDWLQHNKARHQGGRLDKSVVPAEGGTGVVVKRIESISPQEEVDPEDRKNEEPPPADIENLPSPGISPSVRPYRAIPIPKATWPEKIHAIPITPSMEGGEPGTSPSSPPQR